MADSRLSQKHKHGLYEKKKRCGVGTWANLKPEGYDICLGFCRERGGVRT